MNRKHAARILVISSDNFKKKVQIKALKEGKTISKIIRDLLEEWLKQ